MYLSDRQHLICRRHVVLFKLKNRSYKVENNELETVTKWFDNTKYQLNELNTNIGQVN